MHVLFVGYYPSSEFFLKNRNIFILFSYFSIMAKKGVDRTDVRLLY